MTKDQIITKIAEEHHYSKSGYLTEYIKNNRTVFDTTDKEDIECEKSWVKAAINTYIKNCKKHKLKL